MNLPHLLDTARLEHAQAFAEVARLESAVKRRPRPTRAATLAGMLDAARAELRRTESRLQALMDAEAGCPAYVSGSEVAA